MHDTALVTRGVLALPSVLREQSVVPLLDPARVQGTDIFQHAIQMAGHVQLHGIRVDVGAIRRPAGCDVPRPCVSQERWGHCRVLHRHQELHDVKARTQGCHACGAIPLRRDKCCDTTNSELELRSRARSPSN